MALQPSIIISHPIGHFSAPLTELSASIVGFFRRTRLSITSFLGRLSLKTRYGILFSLAHRAMEQKIQLSCEQDLHRATLTTRTESLSQNLRKRPLRSSAVSWRSGAHGACETLGSSLPSAVC